MAFEIIPFYESMLPEAGELLAARHRQDRQAIPELPERFEDPTAARQAVQTFFQRKNTSGVAAVDSGRLLGYLIGEKVLDQLWGRSAWIRPPGFALAPGQEVELVRDLYAALAAPWVQWGIFYHFSVIPTADPALMDAWFRLAFGVEQIYGLAHLPQLDLIPGSPPPGVHLRRGQPSDRQILADLSGIIWEHQVQAPVWGIHLPEVQVDYPQRYAAEADDPEATIWLAFDGDQPLGFQAFYPEEEADDDLLIPPECAGLGIAGTVSGQRGRGVGQALTRLGLAHARESGYRYCLTDWRSTNLLSSRFWPRQGFRPAHYRLVRRIDPRIAWAK